MSKRLNRGISLVLVMAFALSLFTGCRKSGEDYPSVVFPENSDPENTSSTDESSDPSDIDITSITIASPYSDQTIQRLAKLYYCKQHDLMGENTGDSIDINYLDGIDADFIVSSILTSGEGASSETISQWNNDQNSPDVFLTGSFKDMITSGEIISLNEFLADDSSLSSTNLFSGSIDQVSGDGMLYGIPFYSSAKILVGNSEFIPESGKLPFKSTTEQFEAYLREMKSQFNCIPLSSGYDMAPYINSAFMNDLPCSFMMHDEYQEYKEAVLANINSSLGYIKKFYSDGLSSNLTAEGSNPAFSRNAGLWVASSSEINSWSSYYPAGIYYGAMPTHDSSSNIIPMITLYAFCINKNSNNKSFAAQFASFIALDSDARLLLARLEPQTGFLPSIRSADLWKSLSANEVFGQLYEFFYPNMDSAVYCPNSSDKLFQSVSDYLAGYDGGDFNPEACYGQP